MRLEDYWGVGPKTRALLEAEFGTEGALAAIESADFRALTAAGVSPGRATAILRRATGREGMATLATRDARVVYRDILELARGHAVTRQAADRIRVLTPLRSAAAMERRLDAVVEAVESWEALGGDTRAAVLSAFDEYDSLEGGERAAVEAALSLRATGVSGGVFSALDDLDADVLREASASLSHLDGGTVREGADAELDRLRENLAEVDRLEGSAFDVLDAIRQEGVGDTGEFQGAVVGYLVRKTGIDIDSVRAAAPDDAADAADFVGETVRTLAADLRERADEREASVAESLSATVESSRAAVEDAVAAIDHVSLHLSLARFALAYDLSRPELTDDRPVVAVGAARNLTLMALDDESVQPVTYGIGEHSIEGPPADDRVAVMTGANSGGKTTLLETLCQIALLANMGLPVPAEHAQVGVVDAVVFHRRHASFNAGVLEATLRTIVPPLASGGRTLMLVDEFEAITEPGSAADLLHGLVTLTVGQDAVGVFVTHLADDLQPLPETARTDGIFAEGLDSNLELLVDYQPRFNTIGRSTPEFIVSRLVANADDRRERAAYEALAAALGEEIVQRTLADARWKG